MGDLCSEYDVVEEEDDRVHEWERGLPHPSELPSLTQGLIPPDLLSAFNIRPEPFRTSFDVSRASLDTIQGGPNFENNLDEIDEEDIEDEEEELSESKKARLSESGEGMAVKRPRLVWTPQLHKRFVEVVAHLGIKNAVPKTIMQMMNVEGLTRENVASHLQKYRLYLKRMQGISFDPPPNSSPAPASMPPVNGGGMQIPMAGYGQPPAMMQMQMHMPMPMPVMATGHMGNHHHYHNNSNPINHHYHHNYYHHYQYNGGGIMQAAGNNKYGSGMNYHHPPHVAPGDK